MVLKNCRFVLPMMLMAKQSQKCRQVLVIIEMQNQYIKLYPDGKILITDVTVAKNYLNKEDLQSLGRIVNAYLDLAEDRAKRKIPMTMEDWAKRLDMFLGVADRKILRDSGKVTAEIAKAHAESEFEKYRMVQDRLFESDFDKTVKKIEKQRSKNKK